MPPSTYRQVTALISGTERATAHEKEFKEKGHLMGRELREAIMGGMAARAVDYVAAQRRRRELAESMDSIVRTVDAFLLPCAMLGVPSFEDPVAVKAYMTKTCTTAFNVTGHPAHAFPTGFDGRGLPTSAQVVTGYFNDAMVLRIAHAYDGACNWAAHRPTL
jgi:aspartyl-tRNA(Asn)/glutamyl-tRNA(Gln) amidotransferase subunit A